MALAACDASQPAQMWQLGATTASGGMTTVQNMGGKKSCWEINGCGYRPVSQPTSNLPVLVVTFLRDCFCDCRGAASTLASAANPCLQRV